MQQGQRATPETRVRRDIPVLLDQQVLQECLVVLQILALLALRAQLVLLGQLALPEIPARQERLAQMVKSEPRELQVKSDPRVQPVI